MKQKVKNSFYLKRNEEKEDGVYPMMARLSVSNTKSVFSAKLTVLAEMWASGRAKGKSQTANDINRQLDELRVSALAYWRELVVTREKVAAEEVKNLILNMDFDQETLLAYFCTHNEKFENRTDTRERQNRIGER